MHYYYLAVVQYQPLQDSGRYSKGSNPKFDLNVFFLKQIFNTASASYSEGFETLSLVMLNIKK